MKFSHSFGRMQRVVTRLRHNPWRGWCYVGTVAIASQGIIDVYRHRDGREKRMRILRAVPPRTVTRDPENWWKSPARYACLYTLIGILACVFFAFRNQAFFGGNAARVLKNEALSLFLFFLSIVLMVPFRTYREAITVLACLGTMAYVGEFVFRHALTVSQSDELKVALVVDITAYATYLAVTRLPNPQNAKNPRVRVLTELLPAFRTLDGHFVFLSTIVECVVISRNISSTNRRVSIVFVALSAAVELFRYTECNTGLLSGNSNDVRGLLDDRYIGTSIEENGAFLFVYWIRYVVIVSSFNTITFRTLSFGDRVGMHYFLLDISVTLVDGCFQILLYSFASRGIYPAPFNSNRGSNVITVHDDGTGTGHPINLRSVQIVGTPDYSFFDE